MIQMKVTHCTIPSGKGSSAAARHPPPMPPACEPSAATLYGQITRTGAPCSRCCSRPSEGYTAACYGAERAEGLQARGMSVMLRHIASYLEAVKPLMSADYVP
jgi:hypothetical protein